MHAYLSKIGDIMVNWQGRSRHKISGGIIHLLRKKRRFEIGSDAILPVMGPKLSKIVVRGRGGIKKIKILKADYINAYDTKKKIFVEAKMITVKENSADPHYVQRNILNKGAVVQTDKGMVRITSRPCQDGVLNGIIIA
jgi:small subunit ribosomal protein S8e